MYIKDSLNSISCKQTATKVQMFDKYIFFSVTLFELTVVNNWFIIMVSRYSYVGLLLSFLFGLN